MTRVRLKADRSGRTTGSIVGETEHDDVWVQWDDTYERYRIARDQLEEFEPERPPEPTVEEKLVDQIQHLRDMLNTSCDLIIREIERGKK
jgi:hypothetical protein